MTNLRDYPKESQTVEALWGMAQIIILVVAFIRRDWFLLAVSFTMGTNMRQVILWKGKKFN